MVTAKRYFLYGLIFNVVGLAAMDFSYLSKDEEIDLCVEQVRNVIDEDLLGMYRNMPLRGIVGSCLSYYYASDLSKEQIITKMNKIESCIGLQDKELVLKRLAVRHWYVNYLMQDLIGEKLAEIKAIQGSTIDALYFPVHESTFKKIVHESALKRLFYKAGIKNSLVYMQMDVINSTVLYGYTNEIYPSSLCMSCDGKYLKSIDCHDNEIIWDMEKGEKIDLFSGTINWIPGFKPEGKACCVIDRNDNYYAESTNSLLHIRELGRLSNIPVQNDSAIILFKRPQEVSYLCKKAFENSKSNTHELFALRESKSINSIKGFPQNNLKQLIIEQINK